MDIYTIVGEQLFDFVGPFDEAESTAGEIVFGSEVIGFFDFVEPVAIEVVDEFAGSSGPVFVDNGECGTIDGVVYTEFFTNGFNESRFSGSHVAVKSEYRIVAHELNELAGCFLYLVEIFYRKRVHEFLFFRECYQGNHHFFHRDTSVLERIFIVPYVVVVIIGVCKEVVVRGEYVGGADVWRRQSVSFGCFDFVYLLGVVAERFSYFIP